MKTILILMTLLSAQFSFGASPCEDKVLKYHQAVYHRTYKAASNFFLNNFVGRKNMVAHAWGYPKLAFLGMAFNNNYYAETIVERSGKSDQVVLATYEKLLSSGELCQELGEDYKKPRAIKKLLLDRL